MAANRPSKQRAFTLIELMVVLVILAVLATAILPNVIGKSERAKRVKAQADIAVIEGLLDHFYLDLDRYPTVEEGLRVLYYPLPEEETRWKGPYSKKPITNDPWHNPYVYESPGTHSPLPYEVMSYGNDGIEGGEDDAADIVSWPEEESEI